MPTSCRWAGGSSLRLADEILSVWLDTPFEGGQHQRRIDQIAEIEASITTKSEARTQK